MDIESSPFSPGVPVPFEFFVGRNGEIEHLRGLAQASAGQARLKIAFISGERGIGKSSIADVVRILSDREHNIVGCHTLLGGVNALDEMMKKILNELVNESIKTPWHQTIRNFVDNKIKKVGAFGLSLELNLGDDEISSITEHFVTNMTGLLEALNRHAKGLLLILDDINGLASSTQFAHWLKSTVDKFALAKSPIPLCIFIVGLEERRQEMIANNPSIARIFDIVDISRWSDAEAREFYERAFDSAKARIETEQLNRLVSFTGGHPVLAHEIGHAVWRAAPTLELDEEAVSDGIFDAADVVGTKWIEPQIFRGIQNDTYRSILRKLADKRRLLFTRKEIIENLGLSNGELNVLDSFLKRMKQLGALTTTQNRGEYKFPNFLYSLYFLIESTRAKRSA